MGGEAAHGALSGNIAEAAFGDVCEVLCEFRTYLCVVFTPPECLTVFIIRPLSPALRDSGCPERHQYVAHARTNQESLQRLDGVPGVCTRMGIIISHYLPSLG